MSSCSAPRPANGVGNEVLRGEQSPFRGQHVERDPAAARDLLRRKTGQTGVLVIKIGAGWAAGFDKPAIERELARKGA